MNEQNIVVNLIASTIMLNSDPYKRIASTLLYLSYDSKTVAHYFIDIMPNLLEMETK